MTDWTRNGDPSAPGVFHADLPAVCAAHGRFLPCRKGSSTDRCWPTQDPVAVARVRAYQNGERETWR